MSDMLDAEFTALEKAVHERELARAMALLTRECEERGHDWNVEMMMSVAAVRIRDYCRRCGLRRPHDPSFIPT
jgi:hypothetical protein